MRWYYRMGERVWPYEVFRFLFRESRVADGPTVAAFWGAPQDHEEESMQVRRSPATRPAPAVRVGSVVTGS
jgi:anaerobic magnesium-protoporphyrin IX monomethyl ester cyclase